MDPQSHPAAAALPEPAPSYELDGLLRHEVEELPSPGQAAAIRAAGTRALAPRGAVAQALLCWAVCWAWGWMAQKCKEYGGFH